jgi:hypothetical protein
MRYGVERGRDLVGVALVQPVEIGPEVCSIAAVSLVMVAPSSSETAVYIDSCR